MNTKIISITTIILILSFSISCKDKNSIDIETFELAKQEYKVGENMSAYISILQGNKDYTVTIEDKNIVEVEYIPEAFNYGGFIVNGLEKGTTHISIKDNVIDQEEKISITVTNGYMMFYANDVYVDISSKNADIENEVVELAKNDQIIKKENILTLINKDESNLFIIDNIEYIEENDNITIGNYNLSENNQSLSINMLIDENGYSYTIEFINELLDIYNQIFKEEIDQNIISNTKTLKESPPELIAKLSLDVTDQYKEKYPDITKVEITQVLTYIHPQTISIPLQIVY